MPRRAPMLALLLTVLVFASGGATAAAQPRAATRVAHAGLPQRTADADADAVALAKRVLAGGDDARAALLQALPDAGFTVLNDDGSVLAAPGDVGQGLAVLRWEVDAMLASEGSFSTTLGNAGQAFAGAIPELAGAPLDQFLLQGLQAATNGSNPDLRFWARFIAALGQQAQQPSDLTTASDPAAINLDTVQFTLVMRRLAGDLAGFALQQSAPASGAPSAQYLATRRPLAPCTLSDTESTVLDTNALVTTTGFGAFVDYLSEHLSEAGQAVTDTIGKVTGWANFALAYAQIAWTAASFRAGMTMEGNPPLVRTKQAKPATGELRQIDATVSMDINQAQIANCLRGALNLAGLDFSLPNGGPVAGAEVRWYPGDGFGQQIVEFHDDPLYAENQADPSTPQPRTTDANGAASIGVEGVGQNEDLPDDVRPVIKHASVGVAVTVSPASLFSTLETAAGAVAAGPAGLPALLASVLQQSSWAYDGVYHFDVQDWQQVHYRGEGTNDYSGSLNLGADASAQFSQHDTFAIDFDAPGDGKTIKGTGTLTVSMTSSSRQAKQSCSDQERRTYNITVGGTETGTTLNLVLTLDGGPMPTCFLAYTTNPNQPGSYPPMVIQQGSVFLPAMNPDTAVSHAGVHVGTVAIADKDGATLTLPYTLDWPFPAGSYTDKGNFTLTLHQTDVGQ